MKQWYLVLCLLLATLSFSPVVLAEGDGIVTSPKQQQNQALVEAGMISIKTGSSLYSDKQLSTVIGTWQGNESGHQYELVDGVIVLNIAGQNVYVEASAVQQVEQLPQEQAATIGYVRFANATTILAQPKASAPLLDLAGSKIQRFEIVGMNSNYFEVNVAGVTGYVLKTDTTVDIQQPLKVLEKTPIMQGKKQIATLTENGVVKTSKVEGNTYTFNKNYTFTSTDVVETSESAAWPSNFKQTYKVTLTAQKAAGLYNAQGEKFAEIPVNSKVSLVNMTDDFGVIRTLGGTVFIQLSDFKHSSLIAGEKILTHNEMNYKLKLFAKLYPEFMELEEIGKSVEGRAILALTVGTGKKQILMDASMHAREHMTTNVLMEMVDTYSHSYIHNAKIGGYNVRNVLDRVKITFVPMINPDGVTLVQGGKVSTPIATLKKLNGGSTNFKRWKANIRGIDLNRNWDVRWNRLPALSPKWEMAKGPKPFSEPETIALRDFVLEKPFKAYITYHSSGQIMFWEYGDDKGGKAKATALVRDLSRVTGYTIMKNSQTSPTAASEPWVSKKKNIPGVTMEIAPYAGNGPVPLSRWTSVWNKNKTIGLLVANKARGY